MNHSPFNPAQFSQSAELAPSRAAWTRAETGRLRIPADQLRSRPRPRGLKEAIVFPVGWTNQLLLADGRQHLFPPLLGTLALACVSLNVLAGDVFSTWFLAFLPFSLSSLATRGHFFC